MHESPARKYPSEPPYHLSSQDPDPSCDFETKQGWVSPLSPATPPSSSGANLSNSEDVENASYEELKIGDDHATYSKRRTLRQTARSYSNRGCMRKFRVVFAFTIACLSCMYVFPMAF